MLVAMAFHHIIQAYHVYTCMRECIKLHTWISSGLENADMKTLLNIWGMSVFRAKLVVSFCDKPTKVPAAQRHEHHYSTLNEVHLLFELPYDNPVKWSHTCTYVCVHTVLDSHCKIADVVELIETNSVNSQ